MIKAAIPRITAKGQEQKKKSDGTPITKIQSPQKNSMERVQKNRENKKMKVAFDFTKPFSTKKVQKIFKKLVIDLQNVSPVTNAQVLKRKIKQQLPIRIIHHKLFFPVQSNKTVAEIFSQIS